MSWGRAEEGVGGAEVVAVGGTVGKRSRQRVNLTVQTGVSGPIWESNRDDRRSSKANSSSLPFFLSHELQLPPLPLLNHVSPRQTLRYLSLSLRSTVPVVRTRPTTISDLGHLLPQRVPASLWQLNQFQLGLDAVSQGPSSRSEYTAIVSFPGREPWASLKLWPTFDLSLTCLNSPPSAPPSSRFSPCCPRRCTCHSRRRSSSRLPSLLSQRAKASSRPKRS